MPAIDVQPEPRSQAVRTNLVIPRTDPQGRLRLDVVNRTSMLSAMRAGFLAGIAGALSFAPTGSRRWLHKQPPLEVLRSDFEAIAADMGQACRRLTEVEPAAHDAQQALFEVEQLRG